MSNKIIRTICNFTQDVSANTAKELEHISNKLKEAGFEIQTQRICSPSIEKIIEIAPESENCLLSVGSLESEQIEEHFDSLMANDISFNLELSKSEITKKKAELLFKMIECNPGKTFNFSFVFNNPPSTPFFPSASYLKDGFAIGLQPTDLSEDCHSLEEWFDRLKQVWREIAQIFEQNKDFLGVDSSIAPLFQGKSSLINFIRRLGYSFNDSTITDVYIKITNFIKTNNPKPIGLCGLMLPCLEDFELAVEYEKGNFSIERNLFLSLQSGLGIDTYPIGTNQGAEKVLDILKLVQKLSNKHNKPLSIRFVSDGKAKIGEITDFKNQYLKDVVVREL